MRYDNGFHRLPRLSTAYCLLPRMTTASHKLMIVTGEPSGDAHAAALVNALRAASQEPLEIFGSTGPLLRAAGVESVIDSDHLAIMGILEVGRVLPEFWKAYRTLKRAALERQPDAVALVVSPDFNF